MRTVRFDEGYFERGIHYGRSGGYGSSEVEARVKLEYLQLLLCAEKLFRVDFLNGKNRRALDVGCAYGYGLGLLERLGFETYGLDVSSYALRRAKSSEYEPTVLIATAECLPFEEKFDLIICNNLLEHLRQPKIVVQALYTCLRKGGFLLSSMPSSLSPFRLLPHQDETHIHVESPYYWETVFKAFNWVRLKIVSLQWIPLSWLLFRRIVTVSVPLFGDTIVVLGQK